MSLGERLSRFFVAPLPDVGEEARWIPPAPEPARPARPGPRVAAVAVLCAPREARTAGGAAALALAGHTGAPAVLVLEWTGGDPAPGAGRPASPAARRLATAQGGEAAGRLARVALAADEGAAATEAVAALLSADAPAVLVVAGPRGAAMDRLLAEQDRTLFVARGADELAPLAADRLGAQLVTLPTSPGAAALARAGIALAAPLRQPFLEAIGA